MATYRIIAKANSWLATRDTLFNVNKSCTILESNLSLEEAYKILLDMYNKFYDGERPFVRNWGLAVIQSCKYIDGASATHTDGTRFFDYDGRRFSIEEEEEE